MKKCYSKPQLKTERLEIGVFGCYSSTGIISKGGSWGIVLGFFNPMWGLCCGG